MGKTLESVRDKKFVQETLRKASAAASSLPFFLVLKHASDKKPVLLVGSPDGDLKKVALVPTNGVIEGRCKKGEAGIEFYTDGKVTEVAFSEALKKVAQNAGLTPVAGSLKPLADLAEGSGKESLDDLAVSAATEDTVAKLDFSKASWVEFSKVWGSGRSKELKAIDVGFDAVASATEVVAKLAATEQLSKAIEAWLQAKQGDSRRLAMVSTLQEQVQAELTRLRDQRDTEVLKELTQVANDFKIRWAGAPGKDLEGEITELKNLMTKMGLITGSPGSYGPKALKLAAALSQAAYLKSEERRKLVEAKQNDQDREVVLKSAIVSASTRKMIQDLESGGKTLEDKALFDALFDDFCKYGRGKWKYNTSASKDSDLLAGASEGACGTFSFQLARLINLVVRKRVAKSEMVSAKNFITVPLKTVQFIDSRCPGNLKLGKDAEPDRYFYTEHWICTVTGGKYCPTTGTKHGGVDAVVAKQGFKKVNDTYELGRERITCELNKGYGGGGLYTITQMA